MTLSIGSDSVGRIALGTTEVREVSRGTATVFRTGPFVVQRSHEWDRHTRLGRIVFTILFSDNRGIQSLTDVSSNIFASPGTIIPRVSFYNLDRTEVQFFLDAGRFPFNARNQPFTISYTVLGGGGAVTYSGAFSQATLNLALPPPS